MINIFKNIFIKLLRFSILFSLLGVVFFSISIFAQQPEDIREILFEVETTPIIQISSQEVPLLIGLANNFKNNRQLILQNIKVNKGDKTIREISVNQPLFSIKDQLDRIEILGWELEQIGDESKGCGISKQISNLGNEIRSKSFSTSLRIKVADFIISPNPGDQFSITITANLVHNNRNEKITKNIVISFASPLPGQSNWYVGDGHVHSNHSELDAAYWYKKGRFFVPGPTVSDQSLTAKNFGLEWLILTDHEEMLGSEEWNEERMECEIAEETYNIPVMIGEEVGSVIPKVSRGHYLVYGINSYVDASPFSAQDMINKVKESGGFGFIAHPDTSSFSWKDWNVTGYIGYELLRGEDRKPQVRTLHRWDDQLKIDQKPVVIGNSDAHWPEDVGKTRTYLYIEGSITQDSIYNALKNSNAIVTNGPLLTFTINDVVIGQTINIPPGEQATLNIQWTSNDDFGPMKEILVTSKDGKILDRLTKDIQTVTGSTTASYPINGTTYFKLVGKSSNGQIVYTNPIWVTNFSVGGLANTPWPMFHHDLQHTGQSPYLGAQTSNIKWSFQTPQNISSYPIIGIDGTIFIGSRDGKLYAINPDGTLKWAYNTGYAVFSTPSIGFDGIVYLKAADKLYAINSDGTLKWEYNVWGNSSPTIGFDGTIYVQSGLWDDVKLYALNRDGSLKWVYDLNPGSTSSSPAINSDGIIYVATGRKVYAIKPDGTLKWSYYLGDLAWVQASSPLVGSDGTIYVGTVLIDNKLYAINSDGILKWSYTTGSSVGSPAIGFDGTVYVGSLDGKLYAINPDGSLKWSYSTGEGYGKGISSSPAIGSDGTIYFGSNDYRPYNYFFGRIYAVNSNGSLKWSFEVGEGILPYSGGVGSPAIGENGIIYIGACDGKLYAFGE